MPQTMVVTFKVPVELVEKLDELVRMGVFKNRSEALRHALVLLLSRYGGVGLGQEALTRGYSFAVQTEEDSGDV